MRTEVKIGIIFEKGIRKKSTKAWSEQTCVKLY